MQVLERPLAKLGAKSLKPDWSGGGSRWTPRGGQPFAPEEIAQFHRELDAIKQIHNGDREITWSDVPISFLPPLRSR
jgi:hypothetical protein